MTYHDAVMAYMHQDPGREYRSIEITRAIFPELGDDREAVEVKRNAILNVLRSAERYGFVTRRTPVPHQGDYWRLVE